MTQYAPAIGGLLAIALAVWNILRLLKNPEPEVEITESMLAEGLERELLSPTGVLRTE